MGTTKKEYISGIIEKYKGMEGKIKEVEKMRKNHKNRINPSYTGGLTAIGNIAGKYKRGSRAGQLKINEKSLSKLKVNELQRLSRLFDLQENKSMYSALDRSIRKEAWENAFLTFKNASKYVNSAEGEAIEQRRRDMTEDDYENMIHLFERMEGDFLHAYGSDVAEQLYEETEGKYDTETLYDVMRIGLKMGKNAGYFSKEYSGKQNETAQDFLWFWSMYKSEHPRASMKTIEDKYIETLGFTGSEKKEFIENLDDEDY